LNSLKILGLYKAIKYIIKAKIYRDPLVDITLKRFISRGVKPEDVGVILVDRSRVVFRGREFVVPEDLLDQFAFFLSEILVEGVYRLEGSYDVVLDVGGFLGETAWYMVTEGVAKRVMVFEPYYFELCKANLDECNVCEVLPYAFYSISGRAVKLCGWGGLTKIIETDRHDIKCVEAPTTTFGEVLEELSGKAAMKVDCEGCEVYLLEVPCNVLQKVDEYVIEVHSHDVLQKFVQHFTRCGFKVIDRTPVEYRYYSVSRILHAVKTKLILNA